jgi:hypothetical protein
MPTMILFWGHMYKRSCANFECECAKNRTLKKIAKSKNLLFCLYSICCPRLIPIEIPKNIKLKAPNVQAPAFLEVC